MRDWLRRLLRPRREPATDAPSLVEVARAIAFGDEHEAAVSATRWAEHRQEREVRERRTAAARWLRERVERNGWWFPND